MDKNIYKERIIEMIEAIDNFKYIKSIYNFIIMYYLK